MTDRMLMQLESIAAALAAAAAGLIWPAQPSLAAGIAAGGAWSLANLWCLSRVLSAWLGPEHSRRRAIAWLLIKLAVLYPAAFIILNAYPQLAAGFGVGFSLALVVVIAGFALRGRAAVGADGR